MSKQKQAEAALDGLTGHYVIGDVLIFKQEYEQRRLPSGKVVVRDIRKFTDPYGYSNDYWYEYLVEYVNIEGSVEPFTLWASAGELSRP